MNAYQSLTTAYPAPDPLAERSSGRVIRRRMACHARVAACGVDSRAHDPARGLPLTLPVTGILCVLLTIM